MYLDTVPNRNSPPAILLRESFRENGKVKKRTLTNLSKLPKEILELIRRALAGPVKVVGESVSGPNGTKLSPFSMELTDAYARRK
jgi:hypothetical protein